MDTVFDEEFLSEESIIEFLDLIIDKTKPYTFEKGKKKNKKTVTEKQSVLNTQKIIKSFALSSSYISDKFNGNKEIQNKLQEITRITGLTTIDLINQAKQDKNQEAVEESLELLKMLDTDKYIHILLESKDNDVYIKKHLEDLIRMNSAFEGHIESLENESKKKDNNITSIQDNYEKRLIISINDILPTDIDTKEVQKDKIKDFSTKFNYIMTEMKLSQLDFLRIMEEVDEIPNSIKEKKDIETIIEIFENLHSILELTIEDKFMRDIFNEILKNSLELKTLDYKEFVEVLVEEIVKKYNEDNNKFYISEILKRLKENLSIKDLNEEKKKLSLVIIKKADSIIKEEKKLKEESEPNIKGSKKSGSAAKQ
jgi:predicted RNase H-like HicB family nuclease